MKNIFIFTLLFSTTLLMSCEEWVDEPQPEAEVGADAAFSSVEGVDAFLAGTYRTLRGFNDELVGTTGSNDDSEGFGSIMNTRTVKGNDFVQPAFQWMAFEYRYLERGSPQSRKVNMIWDMSYELINSMNLLLEGLEGSPISDIEKTQLAAEARAIRGFAYFQAIKEYALPYQAGRNNVGIPIYTEPTTVSTVGKARSSVGDVYDLLLSDLEYASDNLDLEREFNWKINKAVADGILARVYLEMGMYAEAAEAANRARTSFGGSLDAASYTTGFRDVDTPEWMWGMPYSNDQTAYFGSFASFWDGTRYTPAIRANPTFVETFSDTDIRNLFTLEDDSLYSTSKFVADADFGEDVVLMRVAEMYLIEAEALARQGNFGPAADLLYQLQSNRDPALTAPSGNTGQTLIDEIMLERRKELYAEGLADFPDKRRLQQAWQRDENHPEAFRFAFEQNDFKFFMLLPLSEIDANEAIDQEDQNPNSNEAPWPQPESSDN
ncbi:RagB/SusD family nutrient uptake outer membrane protein [Catalinimonas sp. 4WD22]|uniref:RagB/SusD family nutrient uptake outer membrane protein n=1 Tax=Catalinimonas locisalis TaxID=3133978 RepID=UPI0031017A21